MTNDKGILIKNIYYMLTYAFQVLRQTNYEEIAAENFVQISDLFAAILAKGIFQQLKQGLYRAYITQKEDLSVMRGKLELRGTIRNQMQHTQKLTCKYDELSENNILNQILKTTALFLIKDPSVKSPRKADLRKVMLFFTHVDVLRPDVIHWNTIHCQRNNRSYEMLLNICYFVLDGMLQTTDRGNYRMAAFSDEHMAKLYERFVLEYYRRHYAYLSEVRAAQIRWNLDEDNDNTMIPFLPVMQTDILLQHQQKTLIIDTKYYGHTMQQQYDRQTIHSNNLYQIYTYVKNLDTAQSGNVSGLLLYAKTQESITPDCAFSIGGNRISVKTLDLNMPFSGIAAQLDQIAKEYFA